MVRILIAMRGAMLSHQGATKFGIVSAVFGILAGLASAIGTLLLGFGTYPTAAAGSDVIAVAMAVWIIGRVAYAAFSGGGSSLRFETFRALPIPRGRLARALFVVGLTDPSLAFLALAFAALIALGAKSSVAAAIVGAVGLLLTLLMTSILVTICGALLPSGSRRRQDAGTMIVALVISLVALAAALTGGGAPGLSVVVRLLPSGWAADAVEGARLGQPLDVILPLLGLVAITGALIAAWPALLERRLDGRVGSSSRSHSRKTGRRLLPATPTGAVVAKELRLWAREPLRVTFLMLAAIIGLGAAVIPEITHGTSMLLPFAGILTVVIAGAGGANLYGSDGLSMRLTVLSPASAVPDIRGRQWAWLLLVGPYAILSSVLLTLVSAQGWAWPWLLGILPAVIGGAAGLVPLASVTSVQTLDENGGPRPTWPVKVYAVLILIVVTGLPPAAVLVAGAADGATWLEWIAVPVGVGTGVALAIGLGALAARRLVRRELDILAILTAASNPV
jgi:ABC-2 type transport system permease protein